MREASLEKNVMNKNIKPRRTVMRSMSIQQINEATLVLRHFIEVSAKLLPFFNELSKKEKLMPIEYVNRKKILDVFHSYNFDTTTSAVLMDSTILDKIKRLIQEIENRIPGEPSLADDLLESFLSEHEQLSKNWIKTDCN